jgi:hypothetical protein
MIGLSYWVGCSILIREPTSRIKSNLGPWISIVTNGVFSLNESGTLMYVLMALIADTGQESLSLLMLFSRFLNA